MVNPLESVYFAGLPHYKPQKACSALLRGFESRNRDWEPKNSDFCL